MRLAYETCDPGLKMKLITLMQMLGVTSETLFPKHADMQNSFLPVLLVLCRHEIHHRFHSIFP